ncbi:MAG TPA: hypothetical protein PKB09_00885 [Candidatus Saccharibacteria bacterium]|nr:hypothetical protein [Candidatus Saccharibacteria bacterium]
MTSTKKRINPDHFRTPQAYLATGLVMWLISYILFLLATDSGNTLQWLGFFVAVVWGGIRICQSVVFYLKK